MTTSTELIIGELRNALKDDAPANCVGVNIFFNAEGFDIEFRTRTAESLKRDGISMRNIRGEFVK